MFNASLPAGRTSDCTAKYLAFFEEQKAPRSFVRVDQFEGLYKATANYCKTTFVKLRAGHDNYKQAQSDFQTKQASVQKTSAGNQVKQQYALYQQMKSDSIHIALFCRTKEMHYFAAEASSYGKGAYLTSVIYNFQF